VIFKQKQSNESIETNCPGCNQKTITRLNSNFTGMKFFNCPGCQQKVFLSLSRNLFIAYLVFLMYFIYDLIRTYGSAREQMWVMVDVVVIGVLVYSLLKHFIGLKADKYKIIKDVGKEEIKEDKN